MRGFRHMPGAARGKLMRHAVFRLLRQRMGHHTVQTFLQEGCANAELGFGTKPGGKHCRRNQVERQMPSDDGEILGVVDAGSGVHADPKKNDPEGYDEPEQHSISPCDTITNWLKLYQPC